LSCRTEKEEETGPSEIINIIEEEEDHGCAFLFAFFFIIISRRHPLGEKEINFLSFSLFLSLFSRRSRE